MSATVLVGYATRYGTTREAAEAVAAALRECGFTVDVQPAREVRSLVWIRRGRAGGAALHVPLAQGRPPISITISKGADGTTCRGFRAWPDP